MKKMLSHRRIRWFYAVKLPRMAMRAGDTAITCAFFTYVGLHKLSSFTFEKFQDWQSEEVDPVDRSEPVLQNTPSSDQSDLIFEMEPEGKKYTYQWAVQRISELESQGVKDPVGYFNNEMTDWWLAPGGMMEEEADFVGIAHAIEERWNS